jgi:type I restriction enzyme S subunit
MTNTESSHPPGWTTVALGQISGEPDQQVPAEDQSFCYIDIGTIDRTAKVIRDPQIMLGKDAPSRARKKVATGDTLVSMTRPNLNAVALVPKALDGQIASTGFDVLRPAPGVDPRWLAYLVRTDNFVRAMSELVQGALYPAVRSKDVRGFIAPLAPTPEQTRVADQLDNLLARIQSCQDRLKAVPALLKRFRQAVVSAGMSGELTADWRDPNVDREYFESELHALCEEDRVITYGVVKLGNEVPHGVPCLRTSNVRWLRFENDGVKRVAPSLSAQYARTVLTGGEVLVNVRGTLGGVAVSTQEMKGWNVSREIAVVAIDEVRASADYVALWIASDESQRWLGAMKKGVAYVGINIEDLRKLPVRLPARNEQDEIVRRVHFCLKLADQIDARCAAAKEQARRLAPLTLDKAFRGELVPQDPNDEPAVDLLARIAAARSSPATAKRHRSPRAGRPPRAPKETATMTKSRQDDDVMGQPYLAGHLRRIGTPASAEALFKVAELPVADFYKQLAWEVARGHVKDNAVTLEPGHAAG